MAHIPAQPASGSISMTQLDWKTQVCRAQVKACACFLENVLNSTRSPSKVSSVHTFASVLIWVASAFNYLCQAVEKLQENWEKNCLKPTETERKVIANVNGQKRNWKNKHGQSGYFVDNFLTSYCTQVRCNCETFPRCIHIAFRAFCVSQMPCRIAECTCNSSFYGCLSTSG